jgi:hypothetical protein
MRKSRAAVFVALVLMVGYILPAQCLPVAAACATHHQSCNPPSGGHGDDGENTTPDHSCCYAGHAPEMARQATMPLAPGYFAVRVLSAGAAAELATRVPLVSDSFEFFSPPSTVLRI